MQQAYYLFFQIDRRRKKTLASGFVALTQFFYVSELVNASKILALNWKVTDVRSWKQEQERQSDDIKSVVQAHNLLQF